MSRILDVGKKACADLGNGATLEEPAEVDPAQNLTDETMERIRFTHETAAERLCPDTD